MQRRDRCEWIYDKGVPGGRYLVPGCWSRVHDEDNECQCEDANDEASIKSEIKQIRLLLKSLENRIVCKDTTNDK